VHSDFIDQKIQLVVDPSIDDFMAMKIHGITPQFIREMQAAGLDIRIADDFIAARLQGITPGVTMEGGDVKVTLNGLSSSDMGKISMGDLTTEVAKRTGLWAKRALGLVGTIAATKEILDFEDEVLGNIIDGFKSAGWAAPAPATIPEPPPAGAQPKA
jgi:hypothetical protein